MKTFLGKAGFLIAILSIAIVSTLTLGRNAAAAPSAEFSTDMLTLDINQNGMVTFSGDDDGKERKFVWTFPENLKVTRDREASSNLDKFKVDGRKRKLTVETEGDGSFTAVIGLSSDVPGMYVLQNKEASINFSPRDVTVKVSTGSPPDPPPDPGTENFTLILKEGQTWEIRRNMILSDLLLFSDGGSVHTLPGPEIRVNEDAMVTVTFKNMTNKTHTLVFPGLDVMGAENEVLAGVTAIYTLPTNTPGTFYYAGKTAEETDRGMYGGIVIKSDKERDVSPEFDAIRFFDEIPRVVGDGVITFANASITTVPVPDPVTGVLNHTTPTYRTHEFLVNGKTIDSKVKGNNLETVTLKGRIGEYMVMRMICIGSETHALHLHGHITDTTVDGLTTKGVGDTAVPADTILTDVVRCPSGDVRNVYVRVRAAGTWVWHCHRETHLLNNLDADYPGGMFTHLEVINGTEDN